MIAPVRAQAPAKVNLALSVGSRRADGFHDLATVYQAVDVYDEVRAEPRSDGAITVRTRAPDGSLIPGVADDASHLAVRAAALLRTRTGRDAGVHLEVRKSIPVAAGLAGGSADAAAALVACAELWRAEAVPDLLHDCAARLGSDVPFALVGGTALGTGRGDRVRPLTTAATTTWLLVCSTDGLSTPAVYAWHDRLHTGGEPPPPEVRPELLRAVERGGAGLGALLHNDLQPAVVQLRPALADVLAAGRAAGALAGLVSGSGPTVLLLAADDAHADALGAAVGPVARRLLAGARLWTAHGPVPGARVV